MDDFDYSVQISERDWDAFFQECEECDLLPPALAGLDDSGTSDADDGSASLPHVAEERDSPDADYPVDEPPECTGLPVERYLGTCHIPGPEDLLSCSEEDTHLESINKFFERLKGMEGGGSPRAEARPKETCAPGDPAKVPANLALVPQAKAQSKNLAVSFSPAAKEDKVGGTISAGRGYKALDGAGRAIDTESEEDDVFRSAEAAVELHIREEDWTEDEAEEWQKEKKDRKQAEGSGEPELSLQLESTASAKSLETKELNNAVEAKRPVRTMSAFWKEMEKLTINDILCLRSASSSPGGLPRDTALMDTSEAGDSGYASHLEDTKLDRSSADVSAISDFEEECSLSHSGIVKSSLEPKDTKKQGERSLGSSNSRGVLWESKSYSAGPGMDNDANETSILCSGDSISPPFLSDKSQHGTTFRRMCKNISIQNLRALEAKPQVTQVTSASMLTTAAEKEELQESSSTFQRHDGGSSVPLESSDRTDMKTSAASSLLEDEATEGFGTSFREILAYFFGAGKTGVGQADTAPTEEPAGDGGSVPEMYDHFFSEFETDFFFPFIQETDSGQNKPILTTSGSSHRNLQFPEAYDYFFPDSSSSDSDSDDDREPVRVVSRLDESPGEPSGTGAAPDMYEHFFTGSDWRESLFWRNPLSLRRMRLTAVSGSREGPTSCVVVTADPLARSVFSTFYTDRAVDVHGAVGPQTPLYCLEERIFRDLAEKQRRYADLQTAIAVPNSPLLALKQSDMCLICIAFASWVLKTANPQDSDTWKAALLANISALSAIRYIRRYIRAREEPGNEAGL
ncbi:hypothetical protein COCON_G00141130 [Conger conger]|uniref:PGC-1 and ERR-induced regulator in muscle protein 1 n=1 Tax=Conger conger TaxID=82655 RepID=A0A9Q1DBA2_CONCO|nr:hypothetical protein COCON_G00141130 [Conger conger]